jgi:CRP/FNR family transcriptional regulator, anaerobic regulatory protein
MTTPARIIEINNRNARPAHIVIKPDTASVRCLKIACDSCVLQPHCLPLLVPKQIQNRLGMIIEQRRPIRRGGHLFRQGDKFEAIYVVKTGAIKTYMLSEDGQEQVTGFYLPGEVVGVDGLSAEQHFNNAKALESTTVCKVPFDKFEALCKEVPSLQRYLFQLMGQEIQQSQQMASLLSKRTAEERVARLLLSVSERLRKRKLSASVFRLPMSRVDIGNYLGLAVETVSRVFTRFQHGGVLAVDGKEIKIIDMAALRA